MSLRWRVMLLAMSMVAMVVVLMAVAVYAVISAALYKDIDNQLQSRAQLLIASGSLAADPAKAIEGTAYSDVNAMLVNPGRSIFTANQEGQTLPVGPPEKAVIRGDLFMSRRTAADQRVLAVHLPNGSSLLISKSLAPTDAVMTKLRWVLLIVGGVGMAVAAVAGGMVTQAGLRPVGRLTEAAERVARTDDLRPIPVFGSDELARLTEAFNMMLRALAESRERQTRLVADAGHELRTPLTSLRTNVELLMASTRTRCAADTRTGDGRPAHRCDRADRGIVHAGRRFGGPHPRRRRRSSASSRSISARSSTGRLERVRRRRNDIEFDVDVTPWQVYGDSAGLSRAVLNLMDNAAKWSPSGEHVGIRLRQLNATHAELVVSDHGPGSRRLSVRWCSSGSSARPRRGRCPARVLGWRSSNRSSSNTAGRFASKTPCRAASRRERQFLYYCPDGRSRLRSTRLLRLVRRMFLIGQFRGTHQLQRTLSQSNLRPRRQGESSYCRV